VPPHWQSFCQCHHWSIGCLGRKHSCGQEREKGSRWSDSGGCNLIEWHHFTGVQAVGAMGKHLGREVLHDGLGLDMEILEHGIQFSASKELDEIAINAGI